MQKQAFISQDSVRAAYDSLLYGHEANENPVEWLVLVEAYLKSADIPAFENRRRFALQEILVALTRTELDTIRQTLGFATTGQQETLEQAQAAIKAAASTGNPQLIGLSLLYYRYIRADFNISASDFSTYSFVDDRTLRRYQGRALDHMRSILIHEETLARQKHHRLLLYRALPSGQSPPHMIGRETALNHAERILRLKPTHLQITGPPGIGKTRFIQALLHRQIDSNSIDHLVWISEPRSTEHIYQTLYEHLLVDLQVDLKSYLLTRRVVVVIDGLSGFGSPVESLAALMAELTDAMVYISHIVYLPLGPDVKHLVLGELSRDDLINFVKTARTHELIDMDSYIEHVWRLAGGNPLAIKLAVNNLGNLPLQHPLLGSQGSVHESFLRVFHSLSTEAKYGLAVLVLQRSGVFHQDRIWPVGDGAMLELVSTGLVNHHVKDNNDIYELANAFQLWCRTAFESDTVPELAAVVNDLLAHVDNQIAEDAYACIGIVESVLLHQWPPIDSETTLRWIGHTAEIGLEYGHYAVWSHILSEQPELPVEMRLRLAYCWRKLARWDEFGHLIQNIIENTGLSGHFDWQGRALYELGAALHQQGLFQQAYKALLRAYEAADRLRIEDLRDKINMELARMSLDEGNTEQAWRCISLIDQSDVVTLALKAEVALKMRDMTTAYASVNAALASCHDETVQHGSLLALLGRIQFQDQQTEQAERQLIKAITILERAENPLVLARARCNLAVVWMHMQHDLQEIMPLLQQAQDVQLSLRDRHGLLYTQENLANLYRLMVDGQ